jgi:predicted nucleic acid-binding protein
MNDKIFIDTNVLVYAYDRSEPQKQQQALKLIHPLTVTGTGVISTQVLAEFFVTVTQKLDAPLSLESAQQRIENYQQSWVILDMTPLIVLEAIRGVQNYKFSFWDAQIWAASHLNQISVVLSEDFNNGAVIEGVRFINPFTSDFQLNDWLPVK